MQLYLSKMGGQFDPLGRRVGIDPSFMGLEAKQFGGRRVFTEVRAGGNTLFGSPQGIWRGSRGPQSWSFVNYKVNSSLGKKIINMWEIN